MKIYKLVAIGTAALLAVSAMPVNNGMVDEFLSVINVSAVSDDSGSCGVDCTYSFKSSTGTLTISGTGNMTNFAINSVAPWSGYLESIKSVIIEDGVVSIGYGAFSGCTGLTEVTIPDSVVYIERYAFSDCKGLTGITIPDSVISIERYAFSSCTGLTEITIPDSVTSIKEYTFYGCTGLTEITIPDGVTSIGDYAFFGCTELTEITIPDSVTSIGDRTFYGCAKLTDVYFKGTEAQWESISVGSDNGEFWFFATIHTVADDSGSCGENCTYTFDSSTGTLTISGTGNMANFNYDSDNQRYNMPWYDYRESIKCVIIEDGVTYIGDQAFDSCTGITQITIPMSVTSIGRYAFFDCTGLTQITIPANVASIEFGAGAFSGCSGLTEINVSENNKSYSSLNGVLFNKDKTELIYYPRGKKDTEYSIPDSVTLIVDSAFSYCSELKKITVPDGVTSIRWETFRGCTGLTEINIPDSVVYIEEGAFCDCTGLKEITIPDSVTSIGQFAFYSCEGLTEINIPDSVINIVTSAFRFCSGLTKVTISDSVTSIGNYAFGDCPEIKEVYFKGTEAQWENIAIGSGNENLLNADVHFKNAASGKVFEWGKNNWSFLNTSDYFDMSKPYYFTDSDWEKLKSGCSNAEKETLEKKKNIFTIGSCVGMSLLSALNTNEVFDASEFQKGAAGIYDLPAPQRDNLESLISYYHFMQYTDSIKQVSETNLFRKESEKLPELVQTVSDSEHPTLLLFNYGKSGHAVLAYGIEEGTWVKNNIQYTGRILIYDPNYPELNYNACLYYNSDKTKWLIPEYPNASSEKKGKLRFWSNDLSVINRLNYFGESENTSTSYKKFIASLNTTNYGNDYSINKVNLNSSGDFGATEPLKSDDIYIDYEFGSSNANENNYNIILKDGSVAYEYSIDGTATPVDLTMRYENTLITAQSDAADSVAFSPEGIVDITSKSGDYSVKITKNDGYYTLPWYSMNFKGYQSDSVNIQPVDNGFILSSDNLTNVKILANSDDIYTGKIFTTSYKKVLVYAIDDYTIGIKIDKNNDGTFDTDISGNEIGKGDINCDGEIDIRDITYLNQYIVGMISFDDYSSYNGDIVKDGKTDVKDLGQLKKYIVKLIDKF